jgi:outer membrane lipoprotein-sorting protein
MNTNILSRIKPATLLLIFAYCQLILVQTGLAGPPNEKALSAEDFYRKFSWYQKFSSLKTTFVQKKTIPGLNVHLEAKGTLSVKRPDTVIWEITQPSELKVLLDKNNLSIISETGKDQQVESWPLEKMPSNIKEKLFVMKLWLSFDPEGLYRQYTIFEIKPNQLRFIPKENSQIGFSSLEMHLHPNGYISKLILREDSGDILDYTFQKPQLKP